MKHKTIPARLLCAGFFFAFIIIFSSCKKKDDAVTLNFRTVSHYIISGSNYYYTTYFYDSQGRIEKTLGSNLYSYLTYTTDSAFYKEYRVSDNGLNSSYSIKLDASGRFMNNKTQNYEYNSNGNLVKITFINTPTTYWIYTWLDGNNTKEETYIGGVLNLTTTYTFYTDKPNKAGWNYNNAGISCFFGRANKNLIKKSVTVDDNNVTTNDVDWTYELDGNGLPEKMTHTYNNLGIFNTYHYSYELVD